MKWAGYPRYKESGIEWLGNVPSHWTVGNLRRFATMKTGHTPSRSEAQYWENCDIPWFTLADVWQLREGRRKFLGDPKENISRLGLANSAAELLPAGTVVLSRTASVGFSGIMPRPMATTQDFWNWIPRKGLISEYLLYVFRAMKPEFERLTMGSTHRTIYQPDAARLCTCLPAVAEQQSIVDFLDKQTSTIDALLTKKRTLIERLKEKRNSLASRTVSRGLPPDAAGAAGLAPNAKLRASGVAWIGDVPEHWDVAPLRRHVSSIEQGWSPSCENSPAEEGEWGVVKVGCVNYGRFNPDENKALPPSLEPAPSLEIRPRDVLMSRANTRELVGSAAFVRTTPPRLLLCDKVFRLRYNSENTDPRFLALVLGSHVGRQQIEREATGASGSMQNIGQDSVRSLIFAWPPYVEQGLIADYLERESAKLDQMIAKVEAAIERVQEYRAALITAAVTGKVDVRQAEVKIAAQA